jgi:ABC-type polysaccharide/polyol phosphate export permease
MYNFWVQMKSNYKGLYDFGNPRGYIANVVFYPIIMVLMFAMLGKYAISPEMAIFFAVGMTVSCMNLNIITAITQSYANERWYGTLSLLYATNANRFINYLSRWMLHYPTGLISLIVSLGMIRLTTNLDFGIINWPVLILAMLSVNLSICAFAQFLGIFSIVFTEWLNTLSFSLGVCFILTGIILPASVLPVGLQEIGKCLPMTNGLAAARAVFYGAPFGDVYFDIIREFMTAIVYFAVGYLCFVVFEKIARRTGTLETGLD